MECPECSFTMMDVRGRDHVVDYCAKCCGTWFDPGEICRYIESHSAQPDASDVDEAAFQAHSDIHAQDCPRCQMRSLRMGFAEEVSFLGCSECGGFFLSKEDSDHLVQRYLSRSIAYKDVTGWIILLAVLVAVALGYKACF